MDSLALRDSGAGITDAFSDLVVLPRSVKPGQTGRVWIYFCRTAANTGFMKMPGAWLKEICASSCCCTGRGAGREGAGHRTASPSLLIPLERGTSSTSDPLGPFPSYRFSFLSLTRESLRMCMAVSSTHWPQGSQSFHCFWLVEFSFIDFCF